MDEDIRVEVESTPHAAVETPTEWRQTLVAAAAVVVAVASVVVAWAQVEQVRAAKELQCLQRAEAALFDVNPVSSRTPSTVIQLRPDEADVDALVAECDG